jgi:hypothetical protein
MQLWESSIILIALCAFLAPNLSKTTNLLMSTETPIGKFHSIYHAHLSPSSSSSFLPGLVHLFPPSPSNAYSPSPTCAKDKFTSKNIAPVDGDNPPCHKCKKLCEGNHFRSPLLPPPPFSYLIIFNNT